MSCAWYQVGCHVLDLLGDAEKSLIRPIGEKLSDWERDHRDTIQQVGKIAEDITREVGPDLIRYGVTGQLPTGLEKPGESMRSATTAQPAWLMPVAIGGAAVLLFMLLG